MQKRKATPLAEVVYTDINQISEYIEQAMALAFDKVMGVTSGVIHGLVVTQNGASGIYVATGAVMDRSFAFGQLEAVSGVNVTSFPVSGTRTDTVAARWLEVDDSSSTAYVLLDTTTRTETTASIARRKFGSVQITIEQNTASGALTGNKMPVASLAVTSGGIQTVTDLRQLIQLANINTGSVALLGDVTGTAAASTVAKIQGNSVDTTAPNNLELLQYISASGKYVPKPALGLITTVSGDLSGTSLTATVTKVQNIPVQSGTPADGDVMVYKAASGMYVHQAEAAVAAGVPTSGIIMWLGNTCPAGYTRNDQFADRFPMGATLASNPAVTGGSATHTHDISHTHTVSGTTSTPSTGSTQPFGSSGGFFIDALHTHTFSATTSAASTANSGSASSLPPYLTVLFCQKT